MDEEPARKMPKFSPFTGSSRRLDGKPAAQLHPSTSSPVVKQNQQEDTGGTSNSTSFDSSSRKHAGKLVFGSNVEHGSNRKQKVYFIHLSVLFFSYFHCCMKFYFISATLNLFHRMLLVIEFLNWLYCFDIVMYCRLSQRRAVKILLRRLR